MLYRSIVQPGPAHAVYPTLIRRRTWKARLPSAKPTLVTFEGLLAFDVDYYEEGFERERF